LVKRPYFHVKPLDGMQLANWNDYLSYEEEHGDENSIVRLYERCLIPCAYYPNFWMRYARCMERLQGPQVARDIFHRATRIHLKRNHELFLALARFEQHNGNLGAAREAYRHLREEVAPGLLCATVELANLERRDGQAIRAKEIYETAIAAEQAKGKESKSYAYIVNQYATFLDEALNEHDGARALYRAHTTCSPDMIALWEGALHFEQRQQVSVADRLRRAREVTTQCVKSVSLPDAAEKMSTRALEIVDMIGTSINDVWIDE